MNIVEAARTEIMKPLRGKFRDTGQMKEIRVLMEMNPSLNGLISLGKRLRKIFTDDYQLKNQKSSESSGGYLWETMCIWYLNALSYGTYTVAIPRKDRNKFVPKEILSAFDVYYRGDLVQKLSDPLMISIPSTNNTPPFNKHLPASEIVGSFNDYLLRHASEIRITTISCKTNCSDMIKEPMLWSFVYGKGFYHPLVEVGNAGWTPDSFGTVTTSLVTAPVGKGHSTWKINHAQPRRARAFSGGAYWGLPSNEELGFQSLDKIFNKKTMLASRENIGQAFIENLEDKDFRDLFCLSSDA